MEIKKLLLGSLLALASLPMLAQMDASIKLNEVMTQNEKSLIDEHGARNALLLGDACRLHEVTQAELAPNGHYSLTQTLFFTQKLAQHADFV